MNQPRIGILGGGQLGQMLAQAGSLLHVDLHIMDKSLDFPAAQVTPKFTLGDFRQYEDVIAFGQDKDLVTVEIESVNVDALDALVELGVQIFPQPSVLRTIGDKGLQKDFYHKHSIPTSAYILCEGLSHIHDLLGSGELHYPFVQKARVGGYDGRGVAVIHDDSYLDKLLPVPSVLEELVAIKKELAVIVACNGEDMVSYPVVEMLFHPTANLVEFLACPASISADIAEQAQQVAEQVATALGIQGLLAVELFLTRENRILVNESAPRPHNSGHHTIEACFTSQFEQHLRAIQGWPLGDTSLRSPAVMLNLLGEDGHQGKPYYQGLSDCLKMRGVYPHLYGKPETRPFRKMGHVTVLEATVEDAVTQGRLVQDLLKVVAR